MMHSPRTPLAGLLPDSYDVARRQAEWEREIESLDQKELELHQSQLRLIREQTAIFIKDLAALQLETANLRIAQAAVAGLPERVEYLEQLLGDSSSKRYRDARQTFGRLTDPLSLTQRLDKLEQEVGDVGERSTQHSQDLESAHTKLDKLHGRLAAMESSASSIEHLRRAHADVAQEKASRDALQASLQERVDRIESLFSDSASKHEQAFRGLRIEMEQLRTRIADQRDVHRGEAQLTAVLQRLEDVERAVAESLHGHARELEVTRSRLDQLHGRLGDQHGSAGQAALQDRSGRLERALSELSERHGEELAFARGKLEEIGGRLARCEALAATVEGLNRTCASITGDSARRDLHHASATQRLESLEAAVSEMDGRLSEAAAKHAREVESIKVLHAKVTAGANAVEGQKVSLSDRLVYIEKALSELTKQQTQDVGVKDARVENLHARLTFCEKVCATVEGTKLLQELEAIRTANIRFANETKARDAHCAALADRLDYIEEMLSGLGDRHGKELAATKARLEQLQARLAEEHTRNEVSSSAATERETQMAHLASVRDRVDHLERRLVDFVEKQTKDKELLQGAHAQLVRDTQARDSHQASMAERLDVLERLCRGSDEHLAQLGNRQEQVHERLLACEQQGASVTELHRAYASMSKDRAVIDSWHASVQDRLARLEAALGDTCERYVRELDTVKAMHSKLLTDIKALDAQLESVPQLSQLQCSLDNVRDHHDQQLQSTNGRLEQLSSQLVDMKAVGAAVDSLSKSCTSLFNDRMARDAQHTILADRLDYLERQLGLSADKHTTELTAATDRIEALRGLIADERMAREAHHASVDGMLTKEKEGRMAHHASVHERLSFLEGVVMEYAEKATDLRERLLTELASEKKAREELVALEKGERSRQQEAIAERLEALQQTLGNLESLFRKEIDERSKENRRIWDAIDNHTHDLSAQVLAEAAGVRRDPPDFAAEMPPPRIVRPTPLLPAAFPWATQPAAGPLLEQPVQVLAPAPPVLRQFAPSAVRVHSPVHAQLLSAPTTITAAPVTPQMRARSTGPPSPQHSQLLLEHLPEKMPAAHARYMVERHPPTEPLTERMDEGRP